MPATNTPTPTAVPAHTSSPLDRLALAVMLPRNLAGADVLTFARRAEALGFDELWVVEDLGFGGGIAQTAAVLAATDRIRVGIGVVPVGARNVAFTAMEIGTLAGMFPGRLDLGLGHGVPGWMRQVGSWPASPLTLMREQLTALRALLGGETVTVEGRYVQLTDVTLDSPPSVVPPILTGMRGPRSLALAGELADGSILAEPVTPEYLRATLPAIGATRDHRIVTYNVAHVDDDIAVARAAARPALEWIGEPDWAVHIDPLPFAVEFRALRASCRDRAEFTQRMPDEWVDQLALVGPVDAVRARLDRLYDAGASSAVLMMAGHDPLTALEGLGRVVVSAR